jgi:hypothetical protein
MYYLKMSYQLRKFRSGERDVRMAMKVKSYEASVLVCNLHITLRYPEWSKIAEKPVALSSAAHFSAKINVWKGVLFGLR